MLQDIKNFGFWNLSGVVAENFHKGNIILAGDSAHSFPPAGGFGMNTGIQDAYNLAFKLSNILEKESDTEFASKKLNEYSKERKSVAEVNLTTAMKYYNNSIRIADFLGKFMIY